jgi:acetyltransferase-like isoleucine patch superfamily enzyme
VVQFFRGARNRLFQVLALYAPGGDTVRVWLHRARGVKIGEGSWIGTGALIDPGFPHRVEIGDRVSVGIRCTIVAHFEYKGRDRKTGKRVAEGVSVRIGDDVFIGAGALILEDVTIGHGAVIAAGSVVTRSVPPLTMVQGNPAKAIARCGVPLGLHTPFDEFARSLRPIRSERPPA